MILDPPLIDPKYLTHPDDIKTIVKAIEVIIELIENTPELKEYGMDLPIGNDFKFEILYNRWSYRILQAQKKKITKKVVNFLQKFKLQITKLN